MIKALSTRTARIGGIVTAAVLLSGVAGWGGAMLANGADRNTGTASAAAAAPVATTTVQAPPPTSAAPEPAVTPSAALASEAPTSAAVPPPPPPAPTPRSAPAPRPRTQPAPPPPPVVVPAPVAEVAPPPVAAPPPEPYVNCSLYLFDMEDIRISYLAELENNNNGWNMALNSGDLDKASALYNNGAAIQRQQSLDEQRLRLQYPDC